MDALRSPVGPLPWGSSGKRSCPPHLSGSFHRTSSWPFSLRLQGHTWKETVCTLKKKSLLFICEEDVCYDVTVSLHSTCESWSSRLLSYTALSCQMDSTRPSCFLKLSSPSLHTDGNPASQKARGRGEHADRTIKGALLYTTR